MADETEATLAKALDQDLANDVGAASQPAVQTAAAAVATPFPRRNVSLRPAANGEQSLLAQYERIEEIQQQLKEKLRHERINLMHNYERRKAEIKADYDRQINDQMLKLERAMAQEIRKVKEEYDQKAREYEMIESKYGL